MITQEQLSANRLKFMELLGKLNIDLVEISKYLDKTDYFNKPATTQYFKAYAGGLCQYSLDLYYELAQLVNAYCTGTYTEEDVIKVALFKDIYKAELFEAYSKNVKNELTGQWESVLAYKYSENRPVYGDLAFSSYMVARKFVDQTEPGTSSLPRCVPYYPIDVSTSQTLARTTSTTRSRERMRIS